MFRCIEVPKQESKAGVVVVEGLGVKLGVVGKSIVSFAMCCFSLDLCFKSHFWLLGQAALNYLFLLYSPDSQQCGGGYFSSLDKPRQTWG